MREDREACADGSRERKRDKDGAAGERDGRIHPPLPSRQPAAFPLRRAPYFSYHSRGFDNASVDLTEVIVEDALKWTVELVPLATSAVLLLSPNDAALQIEVFERR